MNVHRQLDLPLSEQTSEPAEITTRQLRQALLNLTRLHRLKASHYRRAANALDEGDAVNVNVAEVWQ
jgi:hypothetical protein